jgi:hypothetical protein
MNLDTFRGSRAMAPKIEFISCDHDTRGMCVVRQESMIIAEATSMKHLEEGEVHESRRYNWQMIRY